MNKLFVALALISTSSAAVANVKSYFSERSRNDIVQCLAKHNTVTVLDKERGQIVFIKNEYGDTMSTVTVVETTEGTLVDYEKNRFFIGIEWKKCIR